MKKWKAFSPGSLSALLSRIVQIKKTADGAQSAVSDLAQDVEEIQGSLDEKQDKLTGAAGQVVGFDASGNPAPQSSESLRGPKGDKGDTGAQGPKGDTGATGPTGPQGPKGDTGAQGPKGDTGAQGPKGDTGATPSLNNTVNSTSTTQAATANAVRLAYELANSKQNKPVKGSFTIPTTGWGTDNTTGYTKYYDVAVSGVTANDRADVVIAPGSVNAAMACGLCPVSETLTGKVRIRASQVPTAAIAAEYWIEKE